MGDGRGNQRVTTFRNGQPAIDLGIFGFRKPTSEPLLDQLIKLRVALAQTRFWNHSGNCRIEPTTPWSHGNVIMAGLVAADDDLHSDLVVCLSSRFK